MPLPRAKITIVSADKRKEDGRSEKRRFAATLRRESLLPDTERMASKFKALWEMEFGKGRRRKRRRNT